jgi:hypothetical protein
MNTITIPNRPFATEPITGFMIPDGIFEVALGKQLLNAHFTNIAAAAAKDIRIYVEGVSHPSIAITPFTHSINNLEGNAVRVLSWNADFSSTPPGTYAVSFIAETSVGRKRIIKKIFVTRVQFNPASTTFTAETPEGVIAVKFQDLVVPKNKCCGGKRKLKVDDTESAQLFNSFGRLFNGHDSDFEFCPPGFLPLNLEAAITPRVPFPGQYGDLPYQDPWWKVLLAIVTVILLIAAAIVESTSGTGDITVTTGGSPNPDTGIGGCCGIEASGGGSNYIAAGLVAAAAAAATACALSDVRDPARRGQDNTIPMLGELTLSEGLKMSFVYPEPVALGKPFAAGLEWEYTRVTTGKTYTYSASDMTTNIHVLSKYTISAPEIVRGYRQEPFLIQAEFFDKEANQLKGGELFVQCFLIGPNGEYRKIQMQDDGISPDEKASDGTYTGIYFFAKEKKPEGIWTYYVIAQDVNNAQPDMSPEEAAQIIGGLVVTHQLVITFDEDNCPFIPDGHVNVIR